MHRFSLLVFSVTLCAACWQSASAQRADVALTPATATAATLPAAPAVIKTPGFSPKMAQPFFSRGPARQAAKHFAIHDFTKARAGFVAHLLTRPKKAERVRAALMIAICDRELANWADAAKGFEKAGRDLPLLSDFSNFHAARAHYFAGDYTKASASAARVDKNSLAHGVRQLLIGDILRAQGLWQQAAVHYERHLTTYPRSSAALYHLGRAKDKTGQQIPEAIQLYRRYNIEYPLGEFAALSQTAFANLLNNVPSRDRNKYTDLSAAEYITRGNVYFAAMRNKLSEKDFAAALGAPGLNPGRECYARYNRAQSVFKQRQRTRSAPLFEKAIEACAKTKNANLQTKAAYQAGRAYTYSYKSIGGAAQKAIARFQKAAAWNPSHSYSDDARLREAEVWQRLANEGDAEAPQRVTEILSKLPDVFPNGDMRGEALWRLAWRAYQAGKYQEAITWLDKQIISVPHEYNYWGEGQAHYWKGRSHAKLGNKVLALHSYEETLRQYPLSYYALLALNRVREEHPRDFRRLKAMLKKPPAGWRKGTPVFSFAPHKMYAAAGFARAVEFLRLGLGKQAQRELAALGVVVPLSRKKITDTDKIEALWVAALLFDRARLWSQSHWILRYAVTDYRHQWPTDANRERWKIAYPDGFWHILEPAAKQQGVPPELLIGIVREESAFNPMIESFANAIGLTQMIFPTARRFGKNLGFAITRKNLRDPKKNVAVGSRFLAFLWRTFDHHVGLMIPAYNAGEGAVWKWLCVRGDWPHDEFAEAIPYDETRGYSKRVLSSYFIYAYLHRGVIPEVVNKIPPHVKNPRRCRKRR